MSNVHVTRRGGHRATATKIIQEIKCLLLKEQFPYNSIIAKIANLKMHQTRTGEYEELIQGMLSESEQFKDMPDCSDRWIAIHETISLAKHSFKIRI